MVYSNIYIYVYNCSAGESKMKRIVSIILVLIMTFALCGFTYERGDNGDELVYTALGDSASNGYGMKEYGDRTYIYGQVVDASYPALFAKAIGATKFNQDCLSGLRSEDLRYLLDPERYGGDAYTWATTFGNYVMSSIANEGIRDVKHLSDLYIQHVTEADVITLDIGLNNFGNFLFWQAQDYLNTGAPFDEVSLNPEMEAMLKTPEFMKMHDALMDLFSGIDIAGLGGDQIAYLVENLLHSLVYSYVDHLNSFDAIVNRIYELNPDCELYVLGLYDCFPELYVTGDMINIGALNTMMMKSINTHLKSFAPHCCEYVYVDVLNTEIFGVPKNLTDPDFLVKFGENNGAAVHPSYAGHQYMFEKLYAKYCVPFIDVKKGDDCFDAVAYAYSVGAMGPELKSSFMPLSLADRDEAAQALYVMAGCPDVSGMTEPFIDVKPSSEYYDAIVWAYNAGIMKGTSSKVFSPELSINRSSMAVVLWRMAGSPAAGSVSFKDKALIASANRTAAQWAVENSLMSASKNYFNPGLLITRADLAQIIYAMK